MESESLKKVFLYLLQLSIWLQREPLVQQRFLKAPKQAKVNVDITVKLSVISNRHGGNGNPKTTTCGTSTEKNPVCLQSQEN